MAGIRGELWLACLGHEFKYADYRHDIFRDAFGTTIYDWLNDWRLTQNRRLSARHQFFDRLPSALWHAAESIPQRDSVQAGGLRRSIITFCDLP